jgi:thioredoxin reductase (NADPH)
MDYRAAIIGAGPIGLELAANFKRLGLDYVHFDAGQIGQTISRWPAATPFFSSPERVAIAGLPVQSVHQSMLTGEEYLAYLRSAVEIYDLKIRSYHRVSSVRKIDGGFAIAADYRGEEATVTAERVIFAHGNMHRRRHLGIPGEDASHVDHYYDDVHRYFRRRVIIVGGRNSAVEAAIRCFRAGAEVTLMHRGDGLDPRRLNSRYHLEISILIDKGKVGFLPSSRLREIRRDGVLYEGPGGEAGELETDFVMLCLGFDKDISLPLSLGVDFGADGSPAVNESTMETTVPGVYLAGTAAGGARESYGIFVGTSHRHVEAIVSHILGSEALVGDGGGRHYPFSRSDIEPTEGKA